MIKIENLYYEYFPQKVILQNINLEINKGELISIIGANGSGKSTLARVINSLLKKKSGSVFIDNFDIENNESVFKMRGKIGMVFQNPDNQFVCSIVEEDVAFGPENLNLSTEQIQERIETSLKIAGMYDYKEFLLQMLSGGQKQKIAIAGILAMNSDYIIFDESTSMIDNKDELIEKIIELNKIYNKTVIFITHDIQEAVKFNRLIVMDNGKIIIDDETKNILLHEKKLIELGLQIPFALSMQKKICEYGFELKKTSLLDELAQIILSQYQ